MVRFKPFTTSIVVMAIVILATSCKKTAKEMYEPQLLLNLPSVKVVPGGTENITVTAPYEFNLPLTFSVECEDREIATVTKTDSIITITGKNFGATNVKISCETDTTLNKTIPVQVYNPKIVETEELIIAFVDTFEYRWCSKGISQGTVGSFYHPVTTDWFHALGSIGISGISDPNGNMSMVVVKAKPGSDALKTPVDYEYVWNSLGSGADNDGSFWNPIPPAGYKALGTVAQRGYNKPSVNDVVCVREDLTIKGALGGEIFWGESAGQTSCKSNLIEPPIAGPHDSCYLSTRTFVGTEYEPRPPKYPVLYVLKIKLPMMAEAPDQRFAPKLTGYDDPPKQTAPMKAKEMSVPWCIVNDSRWKDLDKLAKSPNYRLERLVYYQCEFHNYNQTSELQTNSWNTTVGITKEQRQAWSDKTGMSLSVETGVSFDYKFISGHMNITATVSKELGYEKQYGITELEQKEIDVSINTPPGKAAALWRKYNQYVLKRHNGTRLETVATLDFCTESFVTDEYPHDK